jgi:ELWxxDGT repeat protein
MTNPSRPRFRVVVAMALAVGLGASAAWAGDSLRLLKDINEGSGPSFPGDFVKMGPYVYFRASAGGAASRLFRTDGTSAGTTVVADGPEAPVRPAWLTVVGDTLFFSAEGPGTGVELWKSDGTAAGTSLVKDLSPGPGHSYPQYLTAMGGAVYFRARTQGGTDLWKSDGTEAGTVFVADTRADVCSPPSCPSDTPFSGLPEALTAAEENGTSVLYWVGQAPDGFRRLWRTAGGPSDFAAVSPDSLAVAAPPRTLTRYREELYFVGKVMGETEWGLWRTDGQSTELVESFVQGPEGPMGYPGSQIPANLTVFDDRLYFTAWVEGTGNELRATEGTAATTALVADAAPNEGSSDPSSLTVAGNLLFFVADDGTTGMELWRTDGTANGTFLVEDLCADFPDAYGCGLAQVADRRNNSSAPGSLTALAGWLYFSAYHSDYGRELFRSDGTTVELAHDFFPGSFFSDFYGREFPNSGSPRAVSIGRTLYISAYDAEHGVEPWTLRSLTPAEEISGLIATIQGLLDDGTLKLGQGKSLIGKLELALAALEDGHTKKAVTMLEAFIRETRAFENAGILEDGEAEAIISAAEEVIAEISG